MADISDDQGQIVIYVMYVLVKYGNIITTQNHENTACPDSNE